MPDANSRESLQNERARLIAQNEGLRTEAESASKAFADAYRGPGTAGAEGSRVRDVDERQNVVIDRITEIDRKLGK